VSGTVVLQTHAVTKRFEHVLAVDGIDLSVAEGTVHGLLGRNGAGKTTLLRMILGLVAPDSGSISVLGAPAPAGDVAARGAVAGFVEEPRFYPYLSAQRNLELLAHLDGATATRRPAEALARVGLAKRSGSKVAGYSTGMRHRLGLASVLLRSAKLIVLDEPTIGLDPDNARIVRSLVRELADDGAAVLLSSHNMDEVAELCDQVSIINAGRTVWGGSQGELHAAAPVPAWRVWTSDDQLAVSSAQALSVPVQEGGRTAGGAPLVVHADDGQRDRLVLELARVGVAVRRMEPDVPPLEALFTALTGAADDSGDTSPADGASDRGVAA
jgi:ABC-2 type transport system ATP-binding protein